jgi:amino acid transporter
LALDLVQGLKFTTVTGERRVGLFGATGVGVGAIVGGGILVLAGVAFARTGPSAVVAFAINGVVALITAASFAEVASSFPQSGGAYAFAKRVLSVRAAFATGWILWFAYIVAGALYALGFAYYADLVLAHLWQGTGGDAPAWLSGRTAILILGSVATGGYMLNLCWRPVGGPGWATMGKVVVFGVLLAFGLGKVASQPPTRTLLALDPFFAGGALGLLMATGLTFIALQGFEIIAAIADQIKEPERTIPRSMFLSLAIALTIYLPLLFVVSVTGTPAGQSIGELAASVPETVMAVAVQEFMGSIGYWLVVAAAILSTLSALRANILAASRIAQSMATDRTLPVALSGSWARRGTPALAIVTSGLIILMLLMMVPDLAAAGAAASLIFLVAFTLAHVTAILARLRGGGQAGFRMPLFPVLPIVGIAACGSLALFQAVMVPVAGMVTLLWLGLGVVAYLALFASRAEVLDASAEATDPGLVRLRGRNPLVLVPIANPAHAAAMVAVANAMAPPEVGRVLLLSIIPVEDGRGHVLTERLPDAQTIVTEALTASFAAGHRPTAMVTVSPSPWNEIVRAARAHQCASLLLGMGQTPETISEARIEELLRHLDCDVAIMRAPAGWRLEHTRRLLVPVGGRGMQHELRARVLGAICRDAPRTVTFLRIVPERADARILREAEREVLRHAEDTLPYEFEVQLAHASDAAGAIIEEASDYDALILGLRRAGGQTKLGGFALEVVRQAPCATILLAAK